MKKMSFALMLMFASCVSAFSMSYEEARERAWYLTDKMAYELDLTEEQYNRAYEINLDYLLNIRSEGDLFSNYWNYRNDDLRFVLYDWQYNIFMTRNYFYRPLAWLNGAWYLSLYDRYRRDYFYFSRPVVVNVYRGRVGVVRGSRSPYYNVNIRRTQGLRMRHYPERKPGWTGKDYGRIQQGKRPAAHGRVQNGRVYGNNRSSVRRSDGGVPRMDNRKGNTEKRFENNGRPNVRKDIPLGGNGRANSNRGKIERSQNNRSQNNVPRVERSVPQTRSSSRASGGSAESSGGGRVRQFRR